MDHSICFLIASLGRPSLCNTIRSLYGQFNHGIDKIKVYFDGRCDAGWDYFQSERELYGSDLEMIMLSENLGWYGHGIRNKFQSTLPCSYVHHCDDDDRFEEGVMHIVRNDIKSNYGKMLIYKFQARGGLIWQTPHIAFGQVGTPSGLIPNRPEIFGHWGEGYGGDFQFYKETADKIGRENVVFKNTIIYRTNP